MKIYNNELISRFSYIHIGGKVKKIYEAFSEKEILEIVKKEKNVFIFGNTSKTLFAFDLLDKTIILDRNAYILECNDYIQVGSGTNLSIIGKYFEKHLYHGFSFIRTIPGRLGGSLYSNVSFLNECISKNLISVTLIENNRIITKSKKELFFSYRNSYFKKNKCIILSARFKKVKTSKELLDNEYKIALEKRHNQPHTLSLGSIFQNKKNFIVGKILDDFRGFYLSEGVCISLNHANFLDIKKECKYNEILLLINTLFIVLYKRTGIIFPLEIIILKG